MSIFITISLIIAGGLLLVWRSKRRFARRNSGQPDCYSSNILQPFTDTLILCLGVVLIVIGISMSIGPITAMEDLMIFLALFVATQVWRRLKD